MSRVRVLRVITRLNVGGPAINASLLTTHLEAHGFQTLLVAGREDPAEGSMLALGRLSSDPRPKIVPSLGRSVSPAHDLRAFVDVARIARAFRPDIVHTHLSKAGFVGRLAGRLVGARVLVHTFHGSVFHGYFAAPVARAYLWVERALAQVTTAIVAVTERQRRELIALRIAPAHKVVEIPLGLDLDPFLHGPERRAARSVLGVPDAAPVVAFVGRLVPIKDVPTFLRAVALLRWRLPGLIALVVGDGKLRAQLRVLATELGLDDSCRFLGWRADIESVYAAADVVALPSRNEGSPVSLIEALASARPVVATAVGGVPDLVRDHENGLLVPPADSATLAAALEELLKEPARRERYGQAGREMVRARFHLSRLVTDTERLYRTLLA